MTTQTFTWFPDQSSQHEAKPIVNVVKFGDGYENRFASGINAQAMKWTLTFDRSRAESLDIIAFLRARAALESFFWTNPFNEVGLYVCREWKSTQVTGTILVNASFEQVFEAAT